MSPKAALQDPTLGALTDDRLTREFWIYQRAKGHRFSADDLTTAYVAWHAAPRARSLLDLGSGIGSVVLTLAWKLPDASCVAVEAQAMSYTLLLRNIARNQLEARVTAHHADLRDDAALGGCGGNYELITGTPPYFPVGAALGALDEQRAFARIEYRGGVEAYLTAAAKRLAPSGVLVLCGAAQAEERVERGAAAVGLVLRARCDVVARAPAPPLFAVWTLGFDGPARPEPRVLTLRDEGGARTAAAAELRRFSGL